MNGFVYVDIGYYDRSEYRFALTTKKEMKFWNMFHVMAH